jgi:NTE family protein
MAAEQGAQQECNSTVVIPYKYMKFLTLILIMALSIGSEKAIALEQKPKVGVFLSGGGALGFAHIGMLQAMEEVGITPDYVAGASMGALVGAVYSAGHSPEEIKKIVLDEKLYRKSRLFSLSGAKVKGVSLSSHKKVRKILEKYIGTDNFAELQRHYMVSVSNLTQSTTEVKDSGSHLIDWVLASMSIPAVFEPVVMDGNIYIDGGSLNHFPTKEIREKVDILIGVDVMPERDTLVIKNIPDMISSYVHSVAMISGKEGRALCDYLIDSPAINYYRIMDFEKFEEIYNYGYETMKKYLEDHPELMTDVSRCQ